MVVKSENCDNHKKSGFSALDLKNRATIPVTAARKFILEKIGAEEKIPERLIVTPSETGNIFLVVSPEQFQNALQKCPEDSSFRDMAYFFSSNLNLELINKNQGKVRRRSIKKGVSKFEDILRRTAAFRIGPLTELVNLGLIDPTREKVRIILAEHESRIYGPNCLQMYIAEFRESVFCCLVDLRERIESRCPFYKFDRHR